MSLASGETANQEQQGSAGPLITILSIDEGGVRGIIPAIFLELLEKELQVAHVGS